MISRQFPTLGVEDGCLWCSDRPFVLRETAELPELRYDRHSISWRDRMEPTLLEKFRQAYRNLELFPLVTAEEIDAFRVDYGDDTIARLEQVVIDSDADGKIMFAGHRGCGKSTLLARFSRKMRDQGYFVIFFSIADLIELSAVNHVNILYTIALMLLSEATKRQVAIPEATKRSLLDWLTTTQTQTVTKDLKSEIGAGGDFFKVVTAKLKSESTFREEIKRTYEKRVSDLARKADEIASAIQAVTKKQVLVVIDDLDKLDLALVQSIYRDNINSLFLPKFRLIFTIPISAIRDSTFRDVLPSTMNVNIQQLKLVGFYDHDKNHAPQAIPKEKAMNLFLQVLYKRIPNDLVEPETAKQIVFTSGGDSRTHSDCERMLYPMLINHS